MSQICIIKNALDQSEDEVIQTESVLAAFLEIKAVYPQSKIYLGNPCPESDVTPSRDNVQSIARLVKTDGDFTIVCYPGDLISAVNWVAAKLFGAAVSTFVKPPKSNLRNSSGASGSSNNSLANSENRQRIKERVPTILGRAKAIGDLFAPDFRHFKDGIEVEELLICVCDNEVQVSEFKEGDTPVQEISGKSVTAFGLNQSIIGDENIFKIGDDFTDAPIIAKQNSSVNGQTLLPPNATRVEALDIYFQYPNLIKGVSESTVNAFESFVVNESIIIEGANFGIGDLAITGQVRIDHAAKILEIASTQDIPNYQDFRKINIISMLVNDPEAGPLDLAGLYGVSYISYYGGVYSISLSNPANVNTNFANLTEDASTTISALMTANSASIFLDGSYVVTGIDKANGQISLATPGTVNPDWNRLYGLTDQKTDLAPIRLKGSQENYIGWFTADSKHAKGLLLNFRAGNGIYYDIYAMTVDIEVEYQQVKDGEPFGQIYKENLKLTGRANNRDAIGGSMWIDLPFDGAVRFRARRLNDNGDASELSDEVKFYLAYAYHRLEKLVYSDRVIIRARTVATPNATSQDSRQLNCIAESLVYSYRGGVRSAERIASRNIADLTIMLALHPKVGRRTEAEIDFDRIYQVVDDIAAYFGSEKMAEFNYTLDDANTSFEEIMRMMASVTCSHDRRVNRKLYYDLESADNVPLILFNHRNKKEKSEVRTYNFVPENHFDGIEITYVDSDAGWIEKTLKIPNDLINNPKKINGIGIIYTEQAHIVGWREWNKLVFSRVFLKFTGYCESDLVYRGDCFLSTDDTRLGNCTSGEIRVWNGLHIQVSQPFLMYENQQYLIHIQLKSGQIDVMKVHQGINEYSFILERPPLEALIIEGQIKTIYSVTTDTRQNEQKFILSKKNSIDIFENEILASNYDERYYRNDKDIINEKVI